MSLFGKKEKGLIKSYRVGYRGGHPRYPKATGGSNEFKVFEDRFEVLMNISVITIPHNRVFDVQIVQQEASWVDGRLFGKLMKQANNIHISYESDSGGKLVLRLRMLSGISEAAQARKCQELEDRLRTHHIREKFRSVQDEAVQEKLCRDIPTQIEKLAALRDKGIISHEEFDTKKADLLSRM